MLRSYVRQYRMPLIFALLLYLICLAVLLGLNLLLHRWLCTRGAARFAALH